MSDKELEQVARKYNLREFLEKTLVLTDDGKLDADFIINRKEVIEQLSRRDNRQIALWAAAIAILALLSSWYSSFPTRNQKIIKEVGTPQSIVPAPVADDSFDLRDITTKQFLQLVSSAPDADKVKLYKAHSKLSLEVDTVMMSHLLGNDYVNASQTSIPELVDKHNWSPLSAGDMLIWTILKDKAVLLTEPELWKVSCGQDCPPLTENEIIGKLEKDTVFHFSKEQIQPVLVELKIDRNNYSN